VCICGEKFLTITFTSDAANGDTIHTQARLIPGEKIGGPAAITASDGAYQIKSLPTLSAAPYAAALNRAPPRDKGG
jgi:hypothetical protein